MTGMWRGGRTEEQRMLDSANGPVVGMAVGLEEMVGGVEWGA